MGESILDRYGRVRVAQIVSAFHSDVLRSPTLGPFFHDVPIVRLVEDQTRLMEMVMGVPPGLTGHQIHQAHHDLGIDEDDFEEMLRLLEKSLIRHQIEVGTSTRSCPGTGGFSIRWSTVRESRSVFENAGRGTICLPAAPGRRIDEATEHGSEVQQCPHTTTTARWPSSPAAALALAKQRH